LNVVLFNIINKTAAMNMAMKKEILTLEFLIPREGSWADAGRYAVLVFDTSYHYPD